MNIPGGDDLFVRGGFSRELRFDPADAFSIANSSNHSLVVMSTTKSLDSSSLPGKKPHQQQNYDSSRKQTVASDAAAAAHNHHSSHYRSYYTEEGVAGAVETDFYRNPTVLSRMILFGKYANANKRCRDHPDEASIWVCAKRKPSRPPPPAAGRQVSPIYGMFGSNTGTVPPVRGQQQQTHQSSNAPPDTSDYSMRQLPIHIACTALAFTHDTVLRSQLEQLIARLVVTYPDGCALFDHSGLLPLHEAIWNNASPETISMCLMASPQSIDQEDKFGRTPSELNQRRHVPGDANETATATNEKNKQEIHDMLELGVTYWDQTRQEARLRMKLAVIPSRGSNKSIGSTSVLGTSQAGDKDTICTVDSANYDSAPLTVPNKNKSKQQNKFQASGEIVPMAWEQLERRVLLLEQLLAEMYETNYELAGVVQELKKAKLALTQELEMARAASRRRKDGSSEYSLASSSASSLVSMLESTAGGTAASVRTTLSSSLRLLEASTATNVTIGVVPIENDDDNMSCIKLLEHTERIDELESLVGSLHSTSRKSKHRGSGATASQSTGRRSKRGTGGSLISELSSFSSPTHRERAARGGDGTFIRHRTALKSSDSVVSGLTGEASFFDASIHAVVKERWRRNSELHDDDDEDDDEDDDDDGVDTVTNEEVDDDIDADDEDQDIDTMVELEDSRREVTAVLGTDNLNEMFGKVAGRFRSDTPKIAPESPAVVPSPALSGTSRSGAKAWASPMAIPTPFSQPDFPPKLPASTHSSHVRSWAMPPLSQNTSAENLSELRASEKKPRAMASLSSASLSFETSASSMDESHATDAAEICYPGFLASNEAAHVRSAISLSASSASSTSAAAMSENTSIVSTDNEIYFSGQRYSPPRSAGSFGDELTSQTMSSRGRMEQMVFGSFGHASEDDDGDDDNADNRQVNDIALGPARFNFDIKIPALDTYYTDTGEI